jgi:hypothetical protein
MAISTLWPKPLRWPRFILPLWEHASAGAAQRYVRLAQTRRTARAWQLNAGAAAMRTRYGPGVSIPTDNGAEIEALAGTNPSFAAWDPRHGAAVARRSVRLPAPMERSACALWQHATRHAPLDRHRRGRLHDGVRPNVWGRQ